MPYFPRQRPWLDKPEGAVSVDWDNPLTDRLLNWLLLDPNNGSLKDIARERDSLVLAGNAAIARGPDGRYALLCDGGGDYAESVADYTDLDGESAFTIVSVVHLNTLGSTSSADDGGLFCRGGLSEAGTVILWYNVNADGAGDRTYSFSVGDSAIASNRVNGTVGAAVAGDYQVVAAVMNGDVRRLYVDGHLNNSVAGAVQTVVGATSLPKVRFGGWSYTANYDLNGSILTTLVFRGELSAAEIKAVSDNVWSLLKSRTQRLPLGSQVLSLLVADAEASPGIDAPSVSQTHQLGIAAAEPSAFADSPAVSQVHVLSADDVISNANVDVAAISQSSSITLSVTDASAEATIAAPAITQTHALATADAESQPDIDAPAVSQDHALVAADVVSATAGEALAVDQIHIPVVADAEPSAFTDSPAIGQVHELSAGDIMSAASIDTAAISQADSITLAIADANAGAVIDAPVITQTHALVAA
ncbi:MAG TPA: hypothetical protein ENJ17_01070, partial [Gammaproteobacteria bacterium]|nr:hypothetical protein [Gammaproteobacteria bacterium]